jgi:hypothetical protein
MFDKLAITDLDEEDLYPFADDYQGHLVFEANRIATGDSQDPPTVEMLQALFTELGIARNLAIRLNDHSDDDIPF